MILQFHPRKEIVAEPEVDKEKPIGLGKLFIKDNKTKYFRLRLTDEVSSERPMRDLGQT